MNVKSTRAAWFDEASSTPLIAEQAQRLGPFLAAAADGQIDSGELDAQRARLVAAMRDVEPKLDDELHGKITRLLCELTAFDLMQVMHTMHEARPKTVFQG